MVNRYDIGQAGPSARDKYREKETAALLWLYRWGYASPAQIDRVAGQNRPGFGSKLEEKGLLWELPLGHEQPKKLYAMTEAGLEKARNLIEEGEAGDDLEALADLPYRFTKSFTVSPDHLFHELYLQYATHHMMQKSLWVDGLKTARMMREKNRRRMKQPDAVLLDDYKRPWIFEAERTQKGKERLEVMVYLMLEAITAGHYAGAIVYTPKTAIKNHLENLKRQAFLRKFSPSPSGFVPVGADPYRVNADAANAIQVHQVGLPERL